MRAGMHLPWQPRVNLAVAVQHTFWPYQAGSIENVAGPTGVAFQKCACLDVDSQFFGLGQIWLKNDSGYLNGQFFMQF